jgi:hypothetical protein
MGIKLGRRSFLTAASGLLLPWEPQRVYSFASVESLAVVGDPILLRWGAMFALMPMPGEGDERFRSRIRESWITRTRLATPVWA